MTTANTVVALGRSGTMPGVPEIAQQLLQALKQSASVEIDASELVDADLSLVQLIEAARLESARIGASLSLVLPAGGVLASLLHRSGLVAAMQADDLEFWFHGVLPQ